MTEHQNDLISAGLYIIGAAMMGLVFIIALVQSGPRRRRRR